MSFIQAMEAAMTGFGTPQLTGAGPLADVKLSAIAALALITSDTRIKGADLQCITGPFYVENKDAAADATKLKVDAGQVYPVRNNRELLLNMHIFAPGAYDIRVVLWG